MVRCPLFLKDLYCQWCPLPRQTEIMQAMSGAQVLSTLDALSSFTQLTLAEEDKEKTAFRSHRGLWQFKRMPFGLRNGPSIFQRVMQGILAPFLWIFTLVYIDDIVVFSNSYEEHLVHLNKVLRAIKESRLTLSPNKCHFMYTSILLLGQKVSRLGLSTHQEKVEAVLAIRQPHNIPSLRAFLGMVVYFSHYIPYFSDLASPLFGLLKKDSPYQWNEEQQRSFEELKRALASAPVLAHPMAGRPYHLYSDASDVAIGVALQQVQPIALKDLEGTKSHERVMKAHKKGLQVPQLISPISKRVEDVPAPEGWAPEVQDTIVQVERVIGYWSRTLKPAERNYSTTEREALGVKEGLVKFQAIIEGEKVVCVTDHAALQWARTYENANRRLVSWGAIYASYPGLEIVHRAGKVHSNVDALSRLVRVPTHQSPVSDNSHTIKGVLPQNPPTTWEELTERGPVQRIALVSTRASSRREKGEGAEEETSERAEERKEKQSPEESDDPEEPDERTSKEMEAAKR